MCSSRGTGEPSSTADISTAGTMRTPASLPAAIASETPEIVSWSESASSCTPASAARCTTSPAPSAPSEWVECDCRSKRIAITPAYAIASAAGVLAAVREDPGVGQSADAVVQLAAQPHHGGVVGAGALVEVIEDVRLGPEVGACRTGLACTGPC